MIRSLHAALTSQPRQLAEDLLGAAALFAILVVALHLPAFL
jgi:hypothetical protein